MQYSAGIKVAQQAEDSTYFGKARSKWHEFRLLIPISHENMESSLQRSSSTGVLLAEMGKCFDTNALSGEDTLKLLKFFYLYSFRGHPIIKMNLTLTECLDRESARDVSRRLGSTENLVDEAAGRFLRLWKITKEKEAQLVEINPLVFTPDYGQIRYGQIG